MQKNTLKVAVLVALATTPLSGVSYAQDIPEQAEHIVVTATGREQMLIDAPASITVVTRKEIELKAYRDFTDALQSIAGVSVEGGPGRKGGTSEISIRGMSSSNTLILVNGKAQGSSQSYYNGVGGGAESGWLPPLSAIERIEVVRGPMSSLYGSDALGGVINVITRKSSKSWTGSVGVDSVKQFEDSSGDSQTYRYYLTGGVTDDGAVGLTVFGSYFNREEDEFVYGYKDHTNKDINTKLSWEVSQGNELELSAGYATRASFGTEDMTGESELDTDRRYYSLSHDLEWGKSNLTKSYFQSEVMHNITQDSRYERATFNSQSVFDLDRHMLTVGGQYRQQEAYHPSRAINLDTLKRDDMALFVEDTFDLTSDFSLTSGLRYTHDENYGDKVTPRLYSVYHFSEQLTFKGGISAGYKTPDLKQGESDWVEGGGGRSIDGADVGNDDLQPETTTNFEASLMWKMSKDTSLSLTAYHTDYDDKITKNVICYESAELIKDCVYQGRGYQRVYQYMNEDSAELKGVEASLLIYFGRLKTSFNYTYTDTEITSGENAGEPLNNQPENKLNASFDWQVDEKLNLWARANYKGKTSEIGAGQYPAYTLVDGGVSYALSDKLRAYTGVYNIFNKDISYEEYGKTLDGRRFNMGIQVEF